MSVGWDVKWCPVSRITTPLARVLSLCSHFKQRSLAFGTFMAWLSLKILLLWISVVWKKYSLFKVKYTVISSLIWFYFNTGWFFMFKKAHIILCINTMIKDILRFTILPVKSFSLALVESELWPDTAFRSY